MKKSVYSLILLSLLSAWFTSCAAHKNDMTTDAGTMAEGDRYTKDEFFEEARKQYYRIKTEFPTSPLQVQADYKIADSYYREESYKTAATSYEEFLKTYPGRPEVIDALYNLGMCYVKQMPATPQRDTRSTAKVVDTFTRLMVDYPNSKYAAQAQKYVETARDQLASKIYEVGRFYEKRGDYDAAARRYAELIDQYSEHKLVEEAMAREVRALRRAGKKDKAESLAEKFAEKYPKSEFLSMIKP